MKGRMSLASFNGIEKRFMDAMLREEGVGPLFADSYFEPPIDIFETPGNFVIKMDIAGMKKKDISVELVEDTLVIRGRRDDKSCDRKMSYHQMEISYGEFERRIKINVPIKPDRVTAFYREGFLEVRLPKTGAAGSGKGPRDGSAAR